MFTVINHTNKTFTTKSYTFETNRGHPTVHFRGYLSGRPSKTHYFLSPLTYEMVDKTLRAVVLKPDKTSSLLVCVFNVFQRSEKYHCYELS